MHFGAIGTILAVLVSLYMARLQHPKIRVYVEEIIFFTANGIEYSQSKSKTSGLKCDKSCISVNIENIGSLPVAVRAFLFFFQNHLGKKIHPIQSTVSISDKDSRHGPPQIKIEPGDSKCFNLMKQRGLDGIIRAFVLQLRHQPLFYSFKISALTADGGFFLRLKLQKN